MKYEVVDEGNGQVVGLDRKMSLEGRMNIVLEEVTSDSTRVTVNTRYVVERKARVRDVATGATGSTDVTISFNSGGSAFFDDGAHVQCVPTGRLEDELLAAVE